MSYKLVTASGNNVRYFGDSFTAFIDAHVSSPEYAWPWLLSNRLEKLCKSHAVSGLGYFSQVNNCYSQLDTPSNDMMCVLLGYNDIKTSLLNANGIEHGKSAIKAMLVNQFLDTAVAASHASVTKTGTWANPSLPNSKAAKQGGTALQSATSGDKISYMFSGDNVVIGVCHSDNSTVIYGSVAITVDTVSQGSYSANNKAYNVTASGGRIWGVIILKGFGPGSHTVELTLESSVNFVVDYVGTMRTPADCHPVVIGDIQHDNTGTSGRNAAMDNMSAEIKTMVAAEFPEYVDKIAYAATNTFYSLSNVAVDNIHPNDAGHIQIKAAFERVII